MKKMLICAAAALLVSAAVLPPLPACAQVSGDPPSRIFVEGEDLVYNVRYAFIDLGQVRIKILGKHHQSGNAAYDGKALIDSYRGIPFVDLHATFESRMDSASVFSRGFVGKVRQDDQWDFARYNFDYDRQRVIMEIGARDTVVARKETLQVRGVQQDGLSLFFYAREMLFSGKKVNIPCVVKEEAVNTFIDFYKERTSVEVDAIDYPVDVTKFEGKLDFEGLYGLTGDFTGWFSADEARIPVLAKMKVFIGSVTIELMRWNRQGWVPPRAGG